MKAPQSLATARRLLTVLLWGTSAAVMAQSGLYKGDVAMSVAAGTTVFVDGNLEIAAGTVAASTALSSAGNIHVSGNVLGPGEFQSTDSTSRFTLVGTTNQNFGLAGTGDLGSLWLSQSVGQVVTLTRSLRLLSELRFVAGGARIMQPLNGTVLLTLGPVSTVTGSEVNRFYRGTVEAQSTLADNTQTLRFPIGGSAFLGRRLNLINPGGFGNTVVRARLVEGDVASQPATGQKLAPNSLSATVYYQVNVLSGSVPTGTFITARYGTEEALVASNSNNIRLAHATSLGGNVFNEVTRTDFNPFPAFVTSQTNFNMGVGVNYFVFGTGQTIGGTVANATINIGSTANLSLIGSNGATYQWVQVLGANPSITDPIITGATNTTYTTPPQFASNRFAVRVSETNYEDSYSTAGQINFNPYVAFDLRVFLQGAYPTTPPPTGPITMSTGLQAALNNLTIPAVAALRAPMYAGAQVPTDAVDYLDLELRAAPDASTAALQATNPVNQTVRVWLRSNGQVSHFESGEGLSTDPLRLRAYFNGPTPGNYYVVVRHRNHLPMMSQVPFALSQTSGGLLVDLTNPANVYVNNAFMDFGGHVDPVRNFITLFGGNADNITANNYQFVGPRDQSVVEFNTSSAVAGYWLEDFNLDGSRGPSDRAPNRDVVNALPVSSIRIN